ncbi:caspase domain-containing protein [Russula aff. rugulosa BPL654]|nr:caspase domain-containing protein [Russula aff. rugulosa BPL654]
MVSQNSEQVGPYVSEPPYQPPYAQQSYAQPEYAPQPSYGATLTAAGAPVLSPATGAPFEPPGQTRGLNPVGDPKPHDWRCHPHFRRSRCTGGRKALCIGINYTGQSNPLQGCVDDARNIYKFLIENHSYTHSNIIVLTDDNSNPRSQPTQKNIMSAMHWLVDGAHGDDALFFHYSGHGGRTRDQDGDERDGWDEVIFPLDYKTAGIITDDVIISCLLPVLHNTLFHSNGRVKSSPVALAFQQAKSSPADVVCFSGCKDSQTSADTVQNGVAVGAMSYVGDRPSRQVKLH